MDPAENNWRVVDWKAAFRETMKNTIRITMEVRSQDKGLWVIAGGSEVTSEDIGLDPEKTYFISYLNMTNYSCANRMFFHPIESDGTPDLWARLPVPPVVSGTRGVFVRSRDIKEKSFCLLNDKLYYLTFRIKDPI